MGTNIPLTVPTDASSLLALILSKEHTSDPAFLDILTRTHPDILSCVPGAANGQDVLDSALDPAVHGMAYFAILATRLRRGTFTQPSTMLAHIQQFCLRARKAQLIPAGALVKGFLHAVTQFASRANCLPAVIESAFHLTRTIAPPGTLSNVHTELVKISLLCRNVDRAVEMSNFDIMDIDCTIAPVDYVDHLLYHYLSGIAQALKQDYKRAIHLFNIVISAPGPSISHIQIEAYKKLILIGLLHTSKAPVLPRYVHSQFRTSFKNHPNAKPYLDMMTYYPDAECGNGSYAKLCNLVQKHRSILEKERNYGLAKLCLDAIPRKTVLKLTDLYTALSFDHLTQVLQLGSNAATLDLIRSMVVTNELAATIDESKSLVQFLDQSQQDVSDIGPRLQNMITRAKDLQATVKVMMNQVETDPEFLRRAVKELKDFEKPSPDAGSVNEKNSLGQHSHHSQQQLHQHSQQQEEDLGITPELGWDDQQAFK